MVFDGTFWGTGFDASRRSFGAVFHQLGDFVFQILLCFVLWAVDGVGDTTTGLLVSGGWQLRG